MTKLLEEALETVRRLPVESQDEIARAMLALAGSEPEPVPLSPEERDRQDLLEIYRVLTEQVLPLYYERPDDWHRVVVNSMNEVVPFFDADRMVDEYYKKIYA